MSVCVIYLEFSAIEYNKFLSLSLSLSLTLLSCIFFLFLKLSYSMFVWINFVLLVIITAQLTDYRVFIMVSEHATAATNQSSTMAASNSIMASSSSTSSMSSSTASNLLNRPLLLLSNMSNMMTMKLDKTNYIVWKHQITMVLETYSLYELLEEPQLIPEKFFKDLSGSYTAIVNPDFLIWKSKEKALLTFISSTLSPIVLALTVGCPTALEVWKVLENRFSSVSRSHIMNLKSELHNLNKGGDTMDIYLQKNQSCKRQVASCWSNC